MTEKIILEVIPETDEERKTIELSQLVSTLDEQLSLRISSKTKKNLETLAKKYNLSVGEVVRQLAEQGMELVKHQK